MKKKIAYILSRFPTVSETFILYEIVELCKLGVDVHIFPLIHQKETVLHAEVEVLSPKVYYPEHFSRSILKDHLFWLLKNPRGYVQTILHVITKNMASFKFLSRAVIVMLLAAPTARKIEELGIDHIHAHAATHSTLMAYILSSLTGISYSFTAHSSDIYFNQTMLHEKIRHSSFVATISKYNQSFLQRLYPDIPIEKIKVIHCGIDPAKFQNKPPQRLTGPFNIICVGRLEKIKGHKYLIEALAQLKEHNIDFVCQLVGDGELRAEIQKQIYRLNLEQNVILLGFQPHEKVIELVSQADVLVLPSLSEGIPVAAMEGMASGVAVIATAVTGVSELVEDSITGLLVPSQNSTALTEAIVEMYKSPEFRQKLGNAGQKRVFEEFNLQHCVAKLYDVFQEMS
ncbi:MAG: glycosyltransferase [Anaerolineales bacterium]|nr:glycosyltransferase [Anaerolineales bacterium]